MWRRRKQNNSTRNMISIEKWTRHKLYEFNGRVLGLAVDKAGTVYFTLGIDGLWKLPKNSVPQLLVKSPQYYMMGIVFDGKNTLYICDHQRILEFDISNNILRVLCGEETRQQSIVDGNFSSARFVVLSTGIDIDQNGDLVVGDGTTIRKVAIKQALVSTIARSDTQTYGIPEIFHGLKVCDGTIYATTAKHNIQKTSSSFFTMIAGNGKTIPKDGPLTEAQFKYPCGILMDKNDGSLLVADDTALRRVDIENNLVTTVFKFEQHLEDSKVMAMDDRGNLYIACREITMYENSWMYSRFLWIAKIKENPSYCPLASLPTDLIREIASHITSGRPINPKKIKK